MIRRLLVALAVLAVALTGLGAAPASAANARPGAVWSETLPTGERVEFRRSAEGMDITTSALRRRGLESCTAGYTCAWTGVNYGGTFGRYWTNNIYANTANGVAHCWNMSAPFNNNTSSWANFSTDRAIAWNNWVNCNAAGGTMHMTVNSSWTCLYTHPEWCASNDESLGYPKTTSIRAFA